MIAFLTIFVDKLLDIKNWLNPMHNSFTYSHGIFYFCIKAKHMTFDITVFVLLYAQHFMNSKIVFCLPISLGRIPFLLQILSNVSFEATTKLSG